MSKMQSMDKKIVGCLLVVLLATSLVLVTLAFDDSALNVSAKQSFLDVSIDGETKLGVDEPGVYTASVTGGSGDYSFSWNITPTDNTLLEPVRGSCTLTFTEATEDPYILSVKVTDRATGSIGSTVKVVYDPYTSPDVHLAVNGAPYSYLIETDGNGWYRAINGTDGSIPFESVNASYVINSALSTGVVQLNRGTYNIDSSLLIDTSNSGIIGEQKGAVTLNWTGTTGGYMVKIDGESCLLNNIVKNLELRTNNITNGVLVNFARHFTLTELNIIAEGTNDYSAFVMDALTGNVAWGIINHIHVDKMGEVIQTYGVNASRVVTDITIDNVFAENITGKAIRFINWTDTIDIPYFYVELAADNATGLICNDDVNPDAENGVYDIYVQRFIVDEWAYNDTVAIKLNNCKEIFVDSVYNGDPRGELTTLTATTYTQSYRVNVQSEVYPFTYTHNAGFACGRITASNGTWIQHGVGVEPTSIICTPEFNYFIWIVARNASHFQVGMCYANNETVSDAVINWVAYYQPTI